MKGVVIDWPRRAHCGRVPAQITELFEDALLRLARVCGHGGETEKEKGWGGAPRRKAERREGGTRPKGLGGTTGKRTAETLSCAEGEKRPQGARGASVSVDAAPPKGGRLAGTKETTTAPNERRVVWSEESSQRDAHKGSAEVGSVRRQPRGVSCGEVAAGASAEGKEMKREREGRQVPKKTINTRWQRHARLQQGCRGERL